MSPIQICEKEIVHRTISFLYLSCTCLYFIGFHSWKDVVVFLMMGTILSSCKKLVKLPSRWFHLHLSSCFTCMWCWVFIYWKEYLFHLWVISFLHYIYRCKQLAHFKERAIATLDKRYLMVPTFGCLACTILTEIAKLLVRSQDHALAVGLCSNLAIYGTILLKKTLTYKQFVYYNVAISVAIFSYLLWE